jgi:hypothetical protein
VVGTADDQNLTFYGIPNSLISNCSGVTSPTQTCAYPTNQVTQNAPQNGTYKTFEAAVNKRMSHKYSLSFGMGYTWQHDFPLTYPNTPNGPFDYDYRSFSAKANGLYQAPWGILLSAVYRYQAGANYARTVGVSAPASCACTFSAARGGSLSNTTVYATLYNAYAQDNISTVDLRVEKTVPLGPTKVRLFLDGFNLGNKYAGETISAATGAAFQQPTAILAPRTMRLGFRFVW